MPSTNNIRNTKAIAKNTVFLYTRSIIILTVSIYTSRAVLQALGIDDYGIYNVVGGFVGMFSLLSSSLVSASQRFLSFEMGKDNPNMNTLFCGTVTIHFILAIIILVVFESLGLWFLNYKLNIAPERMIAANWVYQCSVIAFCVNLICVPYNASIIAHEKMDIFAYISIYEVIAKLLIVYLLYMTNADKLIIYSLLMLSISLSLRLLYGHYCKKHFQECHYRFRIDKQLFRSLLSFSGWNFIGSTANVLVTQGINMLINIFFGVALNAARGIADQINNAVNQFVTNFMTALNPQITKSFAGADYSKMNSLMIKGSKYATILYWLFSLTIFIEADYILSIWLVEVPPYSSLFLRLVIVYSIFQSLSNTLYIGMLATGNIKKYQIVMGSLYIGSFVLCYLFFKLGFGPEWGYISTIIAVVLAVFLRLRLLKNMIPQFSIKEFISGAIVKTLPVIVISTLLTYGVSVFFSFNGVLELLMVVLVSVLSVLSVAWIVSLDNSEKKFVRESLKSFVNKFRK